MLSLRKTALGLSLLIPLAAHAEDSALKKLRQDLANRYVEPEPHMALARYYFGNGNRLQAFLLLEHARRGFFPRQQFDEAFERAFSKSEPFDNSNEAESGLLKKHARESTNAKMAIQLADIYISRSDWPKAKEYLGKAIKLEPQNFTNIGAMAEVLRREGKPEEAARVVNDYLTTYPKSQEAYRRRIVPLMRRDAPAAKKLLTDEALENFPQEGMFVFNMGVLLQDEKKLKEAEEHFARAADLAKNSAYIQGWTGRFFLKVKEDEARALEYYLSAYFLDPHFYDSEHAERRISLISRNLAEKKYQGLIKSKKLPKEMIYDENPIVVGRVIEEMGKQWDGTNTGPILVALGHDDENVRAEALQALLANVNRSFDTTVKTLLQDADLRKKGMAAYLALKLWNKEGIEEVKPWLKEDVQLLRYDAISALLQYGGEEGRGIVREHRSQENHPWFKKWLEAVDKRE